VRSGRQLLAMGELVTLTKGVVGAHRGFTSRENRRVVHLGRPAPT
jgi:hypothetical protein